MKFSNIPMNSRGFFSLFYVIIASLVLILLYVGYNRFVDIESRTKQIQPQKNPFKLHYGEEKNLPDGLWNKPRWSSEDSGGSDDILQDIRGLGYSSSGSEAPEQEGVTRHNPKKAWSGVNFYVSSHAPGASLIDMKGNILHQWKYSWNEAFPDQEPKESAAVPQHLSSKERTQALSSTWGQSKLLSNGDVITIFQGMGMIRIDRASNLLWKRKIYAHHDFWLSEKKNKLYVLVRRPGTYGSDADPVRVFDDLIMILDLETGETLKTVSLTESIRNSSYNHLLKPLTPKDLYHANNIEIIESKNLPDPFETGDALVSIHELNNLILIDLEQERVKWTLHGLFFRQHDPDILSNGNILVFDNGAQASRVLEIDPITQKVAWSYPEEPTPEFFTKFAGSNQRLPNGNTLINESVQGRSFEVTPSGEIVWEFFNPHRAGKNDAYVAVLGVRRYSEEYVSSWLKDSSS